MDFPVEEYQQRVDRALQLMEERSIDALMVTGDFTSSQNYRYFSGHVPRDFQANTARPHIFLLTRERSTAICVHFFAEAPAQECWVENIHVYTQPFGPQDALALFRMVGLDKGRVGTELGLDQRLMMPVADYGALVASLPGVEFVDAAELLWQMRMIKSPAEVDCIRRSDQINGAALEKTWQRASIRMTEREIYDLCAHALIEEGSNQPPFAQMTIQSSARYRGKGLVTPFSGPTDEPLEEGDVIFIDSGALHRGYWGEFNRMAVMGGPSAEQVKWHDLTRGIVMDTITHVLRPGITCENAMRECIGLYEKAGLDASQYKLYLDYPYFHLCHGLGMNSSEVPMVRLTDHTVIESGMVFSVEAYVRGHDMQYGSEEDVLITASGAEILTHVDPGLYTIS